MVHIPSSSGTFLIRDVKWWSLFTHFEMVDCKIICDVILVLTQITLFVFHHYTLSWNLITGLLLWDDLTIYKPSSYDMLCKKKITFQGYINILNLQRKPKQIVVSCTRRTLERIAKNHRPFQLKWISFDILHLSNVTNYKYESWMNGIYCLNIFSFNSLT